MVSDIYVENKESTFSTYITKPDGALRPVWAGTLEQTVRLGQYVGSQRCGKRESSGTQTDRYTLLNWKMTK